MRILPFPEMQEHVRKCRSVRVTYGTGAVYLTQTFK